MSMFARVARSAHRFIEGLASTGHRHLVLRDEHHLEVSRRVFRACDLAHRQVWELMSADPDFQAVLPVADVPYLMRVIVTADEIRANFYRCSMENVGDPVYGPHWRNNGELSFIVGPDDHVEPLTRQRLGMYVDLYEPEKSYVRFMDAAEMAHVNSITQRTLLRVEKV